MRTVNRSVFLILILGCWLSSYGQDPQNKPDEILQAVKMGDLQKVLALLDQGVDVNSRGEHQYTPLIAAAKYDRMEIAQALCDRGADVNAAADIDFMEKEWGYTPLLWAANNCYVDMAELLINEGADVRQRGRGGDLPLIFAARRDCLPLVKLFISNGADVDAVDEENGETALIEAVSGGYLNLVDYLIGKGADTGIKSQGGRSLLMLAAYRGHYAEVRYFHEKGLSLNETDGLGLTALHYAAADRVEDRYILEYLIEHGGDVSIKSAGYTPLMAASSNGATIAAGILIAKGAAVNIADNYRKTPLHYACGGIRDYRIEDVTKWEAVIKLLLDKGAQVNTQDRDGKTPLMEAARAEAPQIIEALLEHAARVNVQDNNGWTALMYAAEWNHPSVIRVLASHGADLNLRNAKGNTALAIAKRYKRSAEAYALLKSLGAKG
jgi:serine/threonine-protein phosphatase 6 regulatory ankyrin repeat subunit B